jgi:ABC-type lipoprotein export system ATPase subunit
MNDREPIVRLESVSRRFHAGDETAAIDVLREIDLTVARGESLAVVGPSGSGKTTLLNLIGGLDRPTAGRVEVAGEDLAALDEDALAAVRNRKIGFVFQTHHLLPQCAAVENVLVPALADRRRAPTDRAEQLLQRVGLGDRLHHRPGELSVGQCQRVAVARALVNEPKLLLADEPTGSLDRSMSEQLLDLLVQLNEDMGLTLILVTHAEHIAAGVKRRCELRDGRMHELESQA